MWVVWVGGRHPEALWQAGRHHCHEQVCGGEMREKERYIGLCTAKKEPVLPPEVMAMSGPMLLLRAMSGSMALL